MSNALVHSEERSNDEVVVRISPLVTAEQLAKILQVSVRSIWRMRSSGQLPRPVRIGGNIRWRPKDVELWIAGSCKTSHLGAEA